ncbi:hypothetical protein H0H81_001318 [Sphagnurus paluster]|uniref:alpha-1,2-Mannosidase n=1 Tax=Sphagnurus paluster TaxID=117069 RepID=A0A9P7K496_9AGAR|nr:hypothetical protein H0H81_001318 [Sphagnurus paluster]
MLPLHHYPEPAKTFSLRKTLCSGRGIVISGIFTTILLIWLVAPVPYDRLKEGMGVGGAKAPSTHIRPPPAHKPAGNGSAIWDTRKGEVRAAFVHAYSGYMKHAFPSDELLPKSGGKTNKYNSWGMTTIDSMDTMWIMGLNEQFTQAMEYVATLNFTTEPQYYTPFFETVIRYLGGLLSAHAVSQDPILLARADDLGKLLLPAFNTPSGLPAYSVNLRSGKTGSGWAGDALLFSEFTSCQLEYKYLAKITGRKEYYTAAERVMELLYKLDPKDGLFATRWSTEGKPLDSKYRMQIFGTLDAHGLSLSALFHLKSIEGVINTLLYTTPSRELLYVGSTSGGNAAHTLEHLACFLPGILALGAHAIPASLLAEKTREHHRWAAAGLAYTCYVSYADQRSGLGPDELQMVPGAKWVDSVRKWERGGRSGGVPPGLREAGTKPDGQREYWGNGKSYLLRPETVESLYVMWKTTGDVKWRERGYEIFSAIERHTRTPYGYASVNNLDSDTVYQIDDMPSFFLAETLKYLYLLFDDDNAYPIEKWVFNTEAHPLPVFEWTPWEKKAYKITA